MNTVELKRMCPYLEITDPDDNGYFRYEIRNDNSINYGADINSIADMADMLFNNYRGAFQNLLNAKYPNLKILLINSYTPSCNIYVRGKKYSEARENFIQDLYFSRIIDTILQEFNERAGRVKADFDNKFICSNCGQIKDKNTEFAENVFTSYFCKDCAKKPEIASLISDSHKPNYYD